MGHRAFKSQRPPTTGGRVTMAPPNGTLGRPDLSLGGGGWRRSDARLSLEDECRRVPYAEAGVGSPSARRPYFAAESRRTVHWSYETELRNLDSAKIQPSRRYHPSVRSAPLDRELSSRGIPPPARSCWTEQSWRAPRARRCPLGGNCRRRAPDRSICRTLDSRGGGQPRRHASWTWGRPPPSPRGSPARGGARKLLHASRSSVTLAKCCGLLSGRAGRIVIDPTLEDIRRLFRIAVDPLMNPAPTPFSSPMLR